MTEVTPPRNLFADILQLIVECRRLIHHRRERFDYQEFQYEPRERRATMNENLEPTFELSRVKF